MPRNSGQRGGSRSKGKRTAVLRTRSARDKPPEGVKAVPPDERARKRSAPKRKPRR